MTRPARRRSARSSLGYAGRERRPAPGGRARPRRALDGAARRRRRRRDRRRPPRPTGPPVFSSNPLLRSRGSARGRCAPAAGYSRRRGRSAQRRPVRRHVHAGLVFFSFCAVASEGRDALVRDMFGAQMSACGRSARAVGRSAGVEAPCRPRAAALDIFRHRHHECCASPAAAAAAATRENGRRRRLTAWKLRSARRW